MATQKISVLYNKICGIIEAARAGVSRSVNTAQVVSNWRIGQEIIEEEQQGKARAGYGEGLIRELAIRLHNTYGPGYGLTNLKSFKQFYLTYAHLLGPQKGHAVRGLSLIKPQADGFRKGYALRSQSPGASAIDVPGILHALREESWKPGRLHPNLSWTHYRAFLRSGNADIRSFYEIEFVKNNWCARELERQINTQLYERLALSRDKEGVLDLAKRGQIIQRPIDILKEPVVLEFADLQELERFTETDLERALINKLQAFLLELGQGFAFVGRQKRLTLDGDHFYPDLVFYHIKLKCYVIVELKVGKLTHGDLGQMLMYVNYYDREVVGQGDNPTTGLMLCTEKNDTVVKYVLDEKNERIFASRYKTCLPSEERLRAELRRELDTLPPQVVKK
ncbi:MAG: PDDEXK nuclease domain-containing protein [Elusimicrobiota bacterium]|nr:PDDEXK nuclease domain-containing protein [Elusimicrobiota bacterium]